MKKYIASVIFLILFLINPLFTIAQSLYVSPRGNERGKGNMYDPIKSLYNVQKTVILTPQNGDTDPFEDFM